MKLRVKPSRLALRLRHPKTTVRWRLTLLYGGLFLASGAALLAITYTLVAHANVTPNKSVLNFSGAGAQARTDHGPPSPGFLRRPGAKQLPARLPKSVLSLLRTPAGGRVVQIAGRGQRVVDLHHLIVESGIALGIMAIVSALLGWLVAGRVLRPLRTMTAATQEISEANLHERLALQGPRDELRQLADTIDGLLGRLEAAFDAQRRFVANASHELRTPLTTARALLEMVMSDPLATVQTFRTTCAQVLEEGEQQEQLIDALLALAQGQRGLDKREAMDLASVTRAVLDAREPEVAAAGLRLEDSFESAPISGDRRLVERLVSNLVENAVRHNVPNGNVSLNVDAHDGASTLHIVNTGPPVPVTEIDRLLQPFQRLGADRISNPEGIGLGLSIVAAIANAHDAKLDVRPREAGGLDVEVRFPRSSVNDVDSPSPPERESAKFVGGAV